MSTQVYFAGGLTDLAALRAGGATGILVSYVELRDNPRLLDKLDGLRVFLDCGAWSVASGRSAPIDVRTYIRWLKEIGYPFAVRTALDVLGDAPASERNWRRMLDAGIDDAMPAWHVGEPLPLAARYAARSERVAVGGLASKSRVGRLERFIEPVWSTIQHRRVHLFGVGIGSLIARYRPSSVDCATWLVGSQFGSVFTLSRWPRLGQVVIKPTGVGAFDRARVLPLLPEMRSRGVTWAELNDSVAAEPVQRAGVPRVRGADRRAAARWCSAGRRGRCSVTRAARSSRAAAAPVGPTIPPLVMVPLGDFDLAGYNPREIDETELESLRESIRVFGFAEPVVARREDKHLAGGHQRLVALRVLLGRPRKDPTQPPGPGEGWGLSKRAIDAFEVPAMLVEGFDDDRIRLLNLALNRIGGRWDYGKLSAVFASLAHLPAPTLALSGFSLPEIGDIAALINLPPPGPPPAPGDPDARPLRFIIDVTTESDAEACRAALEAFGHTDADDLGAAFVHLCAAALPSAPAIATATSSPTTEPTSRRRSRSR